MRPANSLCVNRQLCSWKAETWWLVQLSVIVPVCPGTQRWSSAPEPQTGCVQSSSVCALVPPESGQHRGQALRRERPWALWDVPPSRHSHARQTVPPAKSPAGNSQEPRVRKPHMRRLTPSAGAQIFVSNPMIKSFQQRKKTLLCSLLVIGFSTSQCGGWRRTRNKGKLFEIDCLLLSRVISWQLTKHTSCKKQSWIYCKTSFFVF